MPGEGDCFRWALWDAVKNGGVLVHAWLQHPITGTYAHAWVERGNLVFDWQSCHLGQNLCPQLKEDFYADNLPDAIARYPSDEIKLVAKATQEGHYGPWHPEPWSDPDWRPRNARKRRRNPDPRKSYWFRYRAKTHFKHGNGTIACGIAHTPGLRTAKWWKQVTCRNCNAALHRHINRNRTPRRNNPYTDPRLEGNLYRGSTDAIIGGSNLGVLGAGVYLTWEEKTAQAFARIAVDKYGGQPVVDSYKIKPDLNILSRSSDVWAALMRSLGFEPWDNVNSPQFSAHITNVLSEKGYDGVISHDPFDGLVVFDSSNVIGYVDPALCEKCQQRRLKCERCHNWWCAWGCEADLEVCPECSICKQCGNNELDECYECGDLYCDNCDGYDCPKCG